MTDFDVQPGDIYSLGKSHRLMCGDATNKEDVKRLFDGRKPTLVVTSPPYARQRDYDRPIACWDSMMLSALDGHDFADDVQMLVVLGPIHVRGEWVPYWEQWLSAMRVCKWKHSGFYIWDKLDPSPGENQGSCRSEHEFIFHFRKQTCLLNKTVQNKHFGKHTGGTKFRDKNNLARKRTPGTVAEKRPPGSIFRVMRQKSNKTGHPAVFPKALPGRLIETWSKENSICYDPFIGSGTTLHAAEQESVSGLGMEISPTYTAIALARWAKAYPDQQISKIN